MMRVLILLLAALQYGCVSWQWRDTLIPDVAVVGDSLAVAVSRAPGSSGQLQDLLGRQWKRVTIFDAGTSSSRVQELAGSAGARAFAKLGEPEVDGSVLVFQFHHGAAQAAFVARSRAVFAPEVLGRHLGRYSTFAIDSSHRFVVNPR